MSVIPIGPKAPPTMTWKALVRNGRTPNWHIPHGVCTRLNYVLAQQRKLVFLKSTRSSTIPQGASAQQKPWRWRFRSGEASNTPGSLKVRVVASVLPADNSGSTNARWRAVIGATNSAYRYAPDIDTTPALDDVTVQKVAVEISPNTEYACHIEIEDYCRISSIAVYEYHFPGAVDSLDAYVADHRLYAPGNEITDEQHRQFTQDIPYALWRHNGAHLGNLVPDRESEFWTRSAATYVNMVAGAGTTVDANSLGVNLQAQYHNPFHSNNVACVFAVYGRNSGGIAGGDVKLVDANGDLVTLSGFVGDSTGEWKTGTFNLNGTTDLHKVDVHFRGDGVQTLTVHAVSIWEYVT